MAANYPGFNYSADELLKYLASADLFTILLKNGNIIHYTPADKNAFNEWLKDNNIEDIKVAVANYPYKSTH